MNRHANHPYSISFLRYRVALMEHSLTQLNLANATVPIPDLGEGPDPYVAVQVHDYRSIKFLCMDSRIRAASRQVTELFDSYYPETRGAKYFVNVPRYVKWSFKPLQVWENPVSRREFVVLADGTELARVEYLGAAAPVEYARDSARRERLEDVGQVITLE